MNQRIIELAKTIQAYEAMNGAYPQQTIALLIDEILKPSIIVEQEPDEHEYFQGGNCANGGCI